MERDLRGVEEPDQSEEGVNLGEDRIYSLDLTWVDVDFTGCKTNEDLHTVIAQAFSFPSYYRKNLVALWNIMLYFHGTRLEVYLRGLNALPQELKPHMRRILWVFHALHLESPSLRFTIVRSKKQSRAKHSPRKVNGQSMIARQKNGKLFTAFSCRISCICRAFTPAPSRGSRRPRTWEPRPSHPAPCRSARPPHIPSPQAFGSGKSQRTAPCRP